MSDDNDQVIYHVLYKSVLLAFIANCGILEMNYSMQVMLNVVVFTKAAAEIWDFGPIALMRSSRTGKGAGLFKR